MRQQRFKLTIAYRGTHYHGWQKQLANEFYKGPPPAKGHVGIPTIQEMLAVAITHVVLHPINLVGSSRTDSGVHAKGQVAHFDTTMTQIPPHGLMRAINSRLPDDIDVVRVEPVPDSFDAISSTTSKRYQYSIWNTLRKPVFFTDLTWHRFLELDVQAMQEAAALFVGPHDFVAFAKAGHGRESTIRTIYECSVTRRSPRIVIGVEGSGFLWNMVRIMAGTLVQVGLHHYTPQDVTQMLLAKNRADTGFTAPASGLFLQWIKYAKEPAKILELPDADGAPSALSSEAP